MSFFLLIFKSTFRNRLRTILTAVGVAFAIIAFVFLRTVIAAWHTGADAAATDRLVVRNKISLTFSLPLSYVNKVKNQPGVTDIMYENWFGGVYKEPKNFFAKFAADPEGLLRLYPEIVLSDAEKTAFLGDRQGAIVGEDVAQKFGWKIGDKLPIEGDIYPGTYEFTIRVIYTTGGKTFDKQTLFFHWKYLDERQSEARKDQVGIVVIKVADPAQSTEVARSIDRLFASSPAETRTESEKAFQLSFLSMASAVLAAIQLVSIVVLLILMLILANTLAMATRERTTEYAMMRAVGFRPNHIVRLVIGEGFVIGLTGSVMGVLLAPPVIKQFSDVIAKSASFLPVLSVDWTAVWMSVSVALAGGMLAAALPAYRAGKMKIVDALRKVD